METGERRRRHLLYACGVSALTIAHNGCKRAEDVQGPIGFLSHRIASLAGPIIGPMESQWLAFLSFADDWILAAENMLETLFPSSTYVFDKIDSLVDIPEALPGKFDCVVDILPVIIRRVPFLQWLVTLFIWGLNFLLSLFTDGRSDDAAKEREIMVDNNCNELEQIIAQPYPMETTNHAHNNENHYAPKSSSIHNSLGDRKNKALFFEEASISVDKSPNPSPGERENKATYKKVLIGKSPPAKENEIMADNSEGHLAPTSDSIHNSPSISPPIGDSETEASADKSPLASPCVGEWENKATFKKALMRKSPPPLTLQNKAERKATGCETEKSSILNGEAVKKKTKGNSYKDMLEIETEQARKWNKYRTGGASETNSVNVLVGEK